ncbi:AzlC family ABC transporter permease [Psychrobacillus soli]|uniref:AzlC family ABC transporter permease n=1 Tax=Psychrobacillus soli TaxID=1543965 RepID=A0A544TKI2_9BACI|nr:AzlC family ABC transporter permease [Psychrobacillus soli]TQR17943.1 AzlC family ABC transporter permease [Psychrobacillus soli]
MRIENVQLDTFVSQKNEDSFINGVKACVPTLLAYLSIGFACGVVQKTAGLSVFEIALLSLILYAGSAQFIVAAMLVTQSTSMAIIMTIFFINLRHLLLSAALSPYFRQLSPFKNMLVGALLTDETFGVAMNEAAKKKNINEKWMHGLNITAYLNWVVANIAGALLAQWISNPEKFGLEFALPAVFIGLLIISILERSKIKLDVIVTIIAIVIAVGSTLMLSSSLSIIVGTIIAATIGMVVEKWK